MTIHDVFWRLSCGDAPPLPSDLSESDCDAVRELMFDFDAGTRTEQGVMATAVMVRVVEVLKGTVTSGA